MTRNEHPDEAYLARLRQALEPLRGRSDREDAHLSAIETAAVAGHLDPVSPMRRYSMFRNTKLRLAAVLAAAVLALMTLSTGLAFAGAFVMPSPLRAALASVGLDLPDGEDAVEVDDEREEADDAEEPEQADEAEAADEVDDDADEADEVDTVEAADTVDEVDDADEADDADTVDDADDADDADDVADEADEADEVDTGESGD